jgi:hypothetical protein
VSGAEYYEPDAKLQSVEHGGIRDQHGAKSEERGDIRDRNESPSVEHGEIHGRSELKVLNTERSVISTQGAKCQSTEQSVDRHGESGTEQGAIWKRSDSGSVQGARRQERSNP